MPYSPATTIPPDTRGSLAAGSGVPIGPDVDAHTDRLNEMAGAGLLVGSDIDTTTAPKRSAPTPVAGTAAKASPRDHQHPRGFWTPDDHGLVTWTYDPAHVSGTATVGSAGQVQITRVHIDQATTVTNVILCVGVAGATLTTGQCFAALYNSSGALLAQTADQASAWTSTGVKTMALAAPQAVAAGDYYIAFWYNGTTSPAFYRQGNSAAINVGMSAAAPRFGVANTGITTTAPGSLASVTTANNAWWAALS